MWKYEEWLSPVSAAAVSLLELDCFPSEAPVMMSQDNRNGALQTTSCRGQIMKMGRPYKKGFLLVLCSAMSHVAELHVAATAWTHVLCLMPVSVQCVFSRAKVPDMDIRENKKPTTDTDCTLITRRKATVGCGWSHEGKGTSEPNHGSSCTCWIKAQLWCN